MSKWIGFCQSDFFQIGQARFWDFWQAKFLQTYQASFWLALLAYIALFSGCATDIKSLEKFAHTYYYQDAKQASEFALKKSDDKDLLWLTQAGVSAFSAGDESTLDLLEKSEKLFSKYEGEGLLARGGAQVGATMVNDNAMAYKGNIYEGVFLNYYKALAQMEMGEANATRVELNRANDRQRRAKDYYTKQINEAMNEENERYAKSSARGVVDRDSSQRQASRQLESKYSNLRQFRAFDGFINPAVSYVSGLYFALIGDSKGIDYLKESYGITKLETIANDLDYLTSPHFKANAKSSRDFITSLGFSGDEKSSDNNDENIGEDKAQNQMLQNQTLEDELEKLESSEFYTWIVLEEGRQPYKSEFKISLPIVTAEGIYHFGVALPQLEEGISFASHYTLESSPNSLRKESSEFFELADTDKIIATEFEKRLNAIIARAFVSSSLKVATQLGLSTGLGQVNSGLGLLGSIFGSAYSALSTNADLRITSVLPKRILLAKVKNILPTNPTQNPLKTKASQKQESKEQAKKVAKVDFDYTIYADKSKISSIDFALESCYEISKESAQKSQESKKIKRRKKASKTLSLCPYTHNIIYLRHTKAKTYYKILFSR